MKSKKLRLYCLCSFQSFMLLFVGSLAAFAQCGLSEFSGINEVMLSKFWSGDFFSVLEKAKREHKPILVTTMPASRSLSITVADQTIKRGLEPFLKTHIPNTRKEINTLPLSDEQKKFMAGLIEFEGGGTYVWPIVIFLDENGKSIHASAHLSPDTFADDLVVAYKKLKLSVPDYLKSAQNLSVAKKEKNLLNSDHLKDFWSGEFSEVMQKAAQERKPVFVASAPVTPDMAKETFDNQEVRQALSKFLKTRTGIRQSEKPEEDAMLTFAYKGRCWPKTALAEDKAAEQAAARRGGFGIPGGTCGWPAWIILDPNARVVYRFSGHPKPAEFLEQINKANELLK